MYYVPYGETTRAGNGLLLTIGNYYLIRDKDNNEIEATLVSVRYIGTLSHGYTLYLTFVKKRLAKKQVIHYYYKTQDILYDLEIDHVIREIENKARIEEQEQ